MTPAERSALPRLSRRVVADTALFALPETVVQFGTGAFLRGFIDFFIDEAMRQGTFRGRVVAIASTGSGRDGAINDQDGLYTLVVQGASADGPRRQSRVIASLRRALTSAAEWDAVLAVARQPSMKLAFSNTTEIGIAIDPGDVIDAVPPPSFPGKLTRFLLERGRAFEFADDAGLVVIPCELIERNGDTLRDLVLALARSWRVEPDFAEWIARAVPFCNTLVDRIVPGAPDESTRHELEQELGYRDDLMITAEPYRLFAIEADPATRARLTFAAADSGIVLTDDVRPFRERKVRILNGGHTLMASVGLLMGCETVLDAMRHTLVAPFLRRLLFEEIVPSLDVSGGEGFAHDVLLRFANPYLRHALRDITVQHTAKMRVRVVPSIQSFVARTGSVPASLAFGFASYLHLLRVTASRDQAPSIALGIDAEGERARSHWTLASGDDDTGTLHVVEAICRDTALWHADLSTIPGFVERVTEHVDRIGREGIAAALSEHLAGGARQQARAFSTRS